MALQELTRPEIAEPVISRPLLTVNEVGRRHVTRRGGFTALENLSFDVKDGEFVCIVGPSGCGKSTLLTLIAGLDQPDAGEIRFDGQPIRKASPERMLVFQEPALLPWLNVWGNVAFGLKLRGATASQLEEKVANCLSLVKLTGFERAYAHELSGGMKQRAQLARALAVKPRLLLMDEPFAALDAQTRDDLQLELQTLWATTGSTIIFVTHNVREAAILADRVLVMSAAPGSIQREIPVPLPRPRSPESHTLVDVTVQIRAALSR